MSTSIILMIIFGLIAILCVVGTFQAIKEKNLLSIAFNVISAAIFGWFVVMSVLSHGYPVPHH